MPHFRPASCNTKTPCYVFVACHSSAAHVRSGKLKIALISSDTCEHSPPAAEKQTDRTGVTFSLAMKGASAVLHWETALWRQSFPICMMYSTVPTWETTAINTSGLMEGGFCPQPLLERLLFSPYPSWDHALDLPTKLHTQARLPRLFTVLLV